MQIHFLSILTLYFSDQMSTPPQAGQYPNIYINFNCKPESSLELALVFKT